MQRALASLMAWRGWVLGLAVAVLTGLAFSRSVGLGFVAWDDEILLVLNPAFRGFGWEQLRWMAANTLLGHWVPVTWISFALDHAVWGLHPAGYHLTNVLLHAANAGLFCALAARLLRRATPWGDGVCRFGGVAASLLWALHPLRVEAVSWVTGRRDVLSGFLFLLALSAYIEAGRRDARGHRRAWLMASMTAYALALGAKAVLMTAPVVLVALDIYPLGRLPADVRQWGARAFRAVWIEKIPFGVLATLAAVASSVAVSRGTGYQVLSASTWAAKVAVAVGLPVWRTLVPFSLSPLYELPRSIDVRMPLYWGSALLAVAITAVVVVLRRRWPAGVVGWVWYLTFLAPVSALAHAGPQITADRYSYLPALSLSMLAGALVATAARADRAGRVPAGAGVAVALSTVAVLAGLTGLSWQQQGVWQDKGTLWAHAVRVTPECVRCHVNLGTWLADEGQLTEAIAHYDRALELDPRRVELHSNAGLALMRLGRPAEAASRYEKVLARYPDRLGVRVSLVAALVAADRLPEAVERLEEASRFSSPATLVDYFQQLAAAQPGAPVPRLGLVQAYARAGDSVRARQAREALAGVHPALAVASFTGAAGTGGPRP